MIKVIRKNMFTGKKNSMVLDTTTEKLELYFDSDPLDRPYVQDIFPNLNADEREFLMTGTTPKEWNERFKSNTL